MGASAVPVVIRCGTFLDGAGAALRDQAVTVAGARITDVGPWSQVRRPPGTRVVDAGGLTVMPGLFDCHDHLATPPRSLADRSGTPPSLHVLRVAETMRGMLQAGFTTVRDPGGLDLGLKMAVEEGVLPGPRALICLAIITQTAGLSDYTNAVGFHTELLRLPGTPDGVGDGVEPLRLLTRRLIRAGGLHQDRDDRRCELADQRRPDARVHLRGGPRGGRGGARVRPARRCARVRR